MKKFVSLTLALVLLLMALCLSACRKQPEQPDLNTVAYTNHGFSMEQKAILRYEYNEHGNLLNVLVLDWNTLFPVMKPPIQDYDISYRYDSTGKIISHTFHGAKITLEYDENGHVSHGKGYRAGATYTLDYTCDENGTVRSIVLTKGELPFSTQTTTYEYNANGKLVKEGNYLYTYEYNTITVNRDGNNNSTTYIVELNENRQIKKFSSLEKKLKTLYEWSYDGEGKCISSTGYSAYLNWEYDMTCSLSYDEQGRLIQAITDVDEACPTMKRYAVSYEYGEDGLVTRVINQNVGDTGSTSTSTANVVKEYAGGILTKYTLEYPHNVDRAYTMRFTSTYDSATGHHLTSNGVFLDAQGNLVKPEGAGYHSSTYQYDEFGRRIYYRDTEYRSGEVLEDTEYLYHYNDQGEIDQTVKKVLKDTYDTSSTETTDYVDGIKTRETIERFYDKTVYELEKDRRSVNVYEYNADGAMTRAHLRSYDIDGQTEILRREEETLYDSLWSKRLSNTYYDENGELEKTFVSVNDGQGNSVDTTCEYENGVMRKKTVKNIVPKRWPYEDPIYGNVTALSRPTDDTVEYFDASGKLEKTEVNEYEYHETNYRAKHTRRVYDADGTLIETIVHEYDEAGKLIET